jgi:hypothetical protein
MLPGLTCCLLLAPTAGDTAALRSSPRSSSSRLQAEAIRYLWMPWRRPGVLSFGMWPTPQLVLCGGRV